MADEAVHIEWNGDEIKAAIHAASVEGLELAAEHLLAVSSPLVPLEEGDLDRSGEVDVDRDAGEASVSYDRPYAVRQHEELTYRHDEGRQAKYLEQPMNDDEEQATMLALIASRPREVLH